MSRSNPDAVTSPPPRVAGLSKDELDQLKVAVASVPKVDHAPGLKKVKPYWHAYQTWAKARWWNREMLELVSTEFRDRSVEYYRYALESGVTTVNGKVAKPDTIVRNGDRIENIVHRHEPPVTSQPVKLLLEDKQRQFIVIDKPGSIPVHVTGRYFQNSLVEIIQSEFGYDKVYTVNRLDRLTSGCMVFGLTPQCARLISEEFQARTIKKEYIARCCGEFPEEQIVCDQPLITVDRQMGLNIVHPDGKPSTTIFNRLFYDVKTDTSVLHCQPLTGRSHQIRVHLQYLGYPIANDPVYCDKSVWGPDGGRGGLDLTPSNIRLPPAPPPGLATLGSTPVITPISDLLITVPSEVPSPAPSPSSIPPNVAATRTPGNNNNVLTPPIHHLSAVEALNAGVGLAATAGVAEKLTSIGELVRAESTVQPPPPRALLPRETGEDIGMASPVPLSDEAVRIIVALRNMKDKNEDWGRWKDNVFIGKKPLVPPQIAQQNEQARREEEQAGRLPAGVAPPRWRTLDGAAVVGEPATLTAETSLTTAGPIDAPSKDSTHVTTSSSPAPSSNDAHYCPECYLPLHPDPKPEKLYIFLHALRYTTSLGSFETEMPWWAAKEWNGEGWDQEEAGA